MVLSVKGGGIRPTDLRDLRGVLERDHDMSMAGFLSLKPRSKAMWEEASTAGQFEYGGVKYDRMQLHAAANCERHFGGKARVPYAD
jgi:hypothetical protein